MKDPVKLLLSLLVAIAVGLTIAFFLPERTNKVTKAPEPRSVSSVSEVRKGREMTSPEIEPEDDGGGDASEAAAPAQPLVAHVVAMPVEGNSLVVTLPEYSELGQISIEEWSDEAGEFTGKPVKSGTELSLPNPHKKGESLRFIAP